MKPLIKLTRYPYEEPYHIQLLLEAGNGMQHASIEYYTNTQDMPKLGAALIQFPFNDTREHIYEIGSEDPATRCAYFIRLRFFLIRPTGTCGIEVRFNNNVNVRVTTMGSSLERGTWGSRDVPRYGQPTHDFETGRTRPCAQHG